MSVDGVDPGRRRFLTQTATVVGGTAVVGLAWPFAASWQPSARARAIGAPVEVGFEGLEPGAMLIVQWRGKPIYLLRRTDKALESLAQLTALVRDPTSEEDQQPEYARNPHRSIYPEVLILIGLCTHLGCAPKYVQQGDPQLGRAWKGGFFCPCHGSRFDYAGRVFTGVPAPKNLEVPPHKYLDDYRVLIGVDQESA